MDNSSNMITDKTAPLKEFKQEFEAILSIREAAERHGVNITLLFLFDSLYEENKALYQRVKKCENELIKKHGEEDERGYSVLPNTPNFDRYIEDLSTFLETEDTFKVPSSEIDIKDIEHLLLKPSFLKGFKKYIKL